MEPTRTEVDRVRDRGARVQPPRARGVAPTLARVLVVDDDWEARSVLEELLRAEGFSTSTADDGDAALAQFERVRPDLVLTDLQMPRMGGAELCQRLRELDPELPVIVMTAFSDMTSVIECMRAGAEDYLLKPLELEAVLWSLERASARRAAKREQELLRKSNEALFRALNERLVESSVREQEHAEEEARQRAQLNALLENLSDGVAIVDRSGRIAMINDAGRAILGFGEGRGPVDGVLLLEAEDLEGRPLPAEARPLRRALRGETFADYEVQRVRPDGERRRVVSTGTNVRDANGDVALAIVVFRDVTELRRLERQREEYLALISHDLRNPLSSIMLFVTVLKRSMARKGLADEAASAARIEQNVRRMTAMLEDLTEATSLEAQGVTLQRDRCDLRALVAAVADCMDEARARRITIEADDASPYIVFADAPRLERVVANLLTNALKYSADDAPVYARLSRRGPDVHLEVVDRGIGIAPESIAMLFDRYYRTAGGKARATGLGLGLYISRLLVEAHGGRIEVASEVGRGSTFSVILPSHPPSA